MNYDVLKIWTIFSLSVLIKCVLITKKVCMKGFHQRPKQKWKSLISESHYCKEKVFGGRKEISVTRGFFRAMIYCAHTVLRLTFPVRFVELFHVLRFVSWIYFTYTFFFYKHLYFLAEPGKKIEIATNKWSDFSLSVLINCVLIKNKMCSGAKKGSVPFWKSGLLIITRHSSSQLGFGEETQERVEEPLHTILGDKIYTGIDHAWGREVYATCGEQLDGKSADRNLWGRWHGEPPLTTASNSIP